MSQELGTMSPISRETDKVLDQLFRSARTHRNWTSEPVPTETLKAIYDTMKFGPTSANTSPLRIVFITTPEAKERLLPAMSEGNVEKTRHAPVVAIFATDVKFYEKLERLMPTIDLASFFSENPEIAEFSGAQGTNLQAAYFMIVARAYGLDCGPMGGFNSGKVNEEFFPEGDWKVDFICNMGHGEPSALMPRLPRLDFEETCKII